MKVKFPEPDIIDFKNVLLRKDKGKRIHCAELHIDREILRFLWEEYFGEKWIEPTDYETKKFPLKILSPFIINLALIH